MKVITIKSKESVSPEIQRDIHYTLRMEHRTDHVFRDMGDAQYSATITMENPAEAVESMIKNSEAIPGHELLIDVVDLEANQAERMLVEGGKVLERKTGTWEWKMDD